MDRARREHLQHVDVARVGPDLVDAIPVGAVGLAAVDGGHPAVLTVTCEQYDAGIGFDTHLIAKHIHLAGHTIGIALKVRVGAERPSAQVDGDEPHVLKNDVFAALTLGCMHLDDFEHVLTLTRAVYHAPYPFSDRTQIFIVSLSFRLPRFESRAAEHRAAVEAL